MHYSLFPASRRSRVRLSITLASILALTAALLLGWTTYSHRQRAVPFEEQVQTLPRRADATSALVDIPAMALRTPAEVDALLGRPENVTPIECGPCSPCDPSREPGEYPTYSSQEPGEYRTYSRPGAFGARSSVRFYRGRAVDFMFFFTERSRTAEETIRKIGINLSGVPPTVAYPVSKSWHNLRLNGVLFEAVDAIGDPDGYHAAGASVKP